MKCPTLTALSLTALLGCSTLTAPVSAGEAIDLGPAIATALPRIDEIAETLVASGAIPGLSIAIVHDDEVVYLKGFGVREVGGTDLIDVDTVFPLASVSKPLSATVVAALVSDGIVSWDTPVSTLDPSFRLYDPYATNAVTLRDLFAHRSGLFGGAGDDLELVGYNRLDILQRVGLLEPITGLRASFSYSNYGITAAGLSAALPTGKSWEELAEERLFVPLGMTHTSARFADFVAEPEHVTIHTLIDGAWRAAPPRNADQQAPAGGISSTARDMAVWMRLQLSGGAIDGKQIVAPEALSEAHKPMIGRGNHPVTGNPSYYGLGWMIDSDSFGEHWNHNGAFTSGVRSVVDLLPESGLGIVVLTNGFPSGAPEGIVASFYDLVFTGSLTQDWTGLYDGVFKAGYQQFVGAVSGPFAELPPSPAPPLPLASYAGTFANDYVGEAQIIDEAGNLVIALGPGGTTRFPLTHYDRDTFLFVPAPETPELKLPVYFTIGNGRLQQAIDLQIGMIGANSATHLKRLQ